jgi:diaminohydroxyphosphoribosylaminopyrimidine deaminase/5-amino-6-(5-phosphoribosylamino)uracil reductase
LRGRSDAVVVGIGTILADDPELTTRLASGNGCDAVRVVIDSRLRTPPAAKAVQAVRSSLAGTIIVAAERIADESRHAALEAAGAEVVLVPSDAASGRVDVRAVARLLAERGLLAVLLESGGELAASFWQAGLVDEVSFFVAPKIIGGRDAATPVGGDGLSAAMANAVTLEELTIRRFGQDIALEGKVDAQYVYRNH